MAPRCSFWIAWLAVAALTLGATTVEELSFDEVVARSAAIVHGKVVGSRTSWDPERVAIWTHYDIQVRAALKGGPGSILTISEPGGEVDGKHMQIAGAPRYQIGEEVVVFAAETPIGYLRTCGWGQGKFQVLPAAGAASGRVVQRAPLTVRTLSTGGERAVSPDDGRDLAAFLARVRALVASQRRSQR